MFNYITLFFAGEARFFGRGGDGGREERSDQGRFRFRDGVTTNVASLCTVNSGHEKKAGREEFVPYIIMNEAKKTPREKQRIQLILGF